MQGIKSSTCGLTDFYCQCGAQQQQIQNTTLKCLCTSTCTTNELFRKPSMLKSSWSMANTSWQRYTKQPRRSAKRRCPTTARRTMPRCPTLQAPATQQPATRAHQVDRVTQRRQALVPREQPPPRRPPDPHHSQARLPLEACWLLVLRWRLVVWRCLRCRRMTVQDP